MFSHQQNQRTRGEQFLPERGRGKGEMTQIMYTHISKCKNDKIIK
jgi:hypothetical protein